MKSKQTRADKAYEKGIHDGKQGGSLDDFVESFTKSMPWPVSKDEERAYHKGYEYGVRHRSDKKQESYRPSAYSTSSGGGGGGGLINADQAEWAVIVIAVIIIWATFHYVGNAIRAVNNRAHQEYSNYLVSLPSKETTSIYKIDIAQKTEGFFSEGRQPAFSPDGTKIVFVRENSSGERLFLADADGNNLRYFANASQFCWWPGGKTIATIGRRVDGEAKIIWHSPFSRRASSVGGNLGLKNDVESFACLKNSFFVFIAEKDDRKILYIAERYYRMYPSPVVEYLNGKNLCLVSWSPDCNNVVVFKDGHTLIIPLDYIKVYFEHKTYKRKISEFFVRSKHSQDNGRHNSKKIAGASFRVDRLSVSQPKEAFTLQARGHVFCSWSPDSKMLVYDLDNELRIRPDFKKADFKVITRGSHPLWSPDGQKIAFKDGSDLYLINPNGADRHQLAKDVENFSWSPDSKQILFTRESGLKNS